MNLRVIICFSLLAVLCSSTFISRSQNNDSLERVLKTNVPDSVRIQILNKLSFNNLISNPKVAHEFAGDAIVLAEKINSERGMAISYLNRGRTYYFLSNYQKALEFSFKALTQYEKLNDKKGIASAANNIGGLYYVQKSYSNAMEFYQRALVLREELGEKSSVAALLGNIGAVFYDQFKYDEALKYYYTALEKLKADPNQLYTLGTTYGCIGNAYWGKKNFQKAIEFHNKALSIQRGQNDNYGIANTLTNLGGLFNDFDKPDSSIRYLEKAIPLSVEHNNKKALMTAFSFMSTALELKGDLKGAIQYQKLYSKYQDSLFNSESATKMAEVLSEYETEKKDRERDLIEKVKEAEQNSKLEKQRLITIAISIVAILIFIFLIFVYRNFKEKQRTNAIIIEQKKLVDEKQKEMLDSIHYAKRIQTTLMTSEKYIAKNLTRLSEKK